jgi:type III pantothenate kinase
MTPDVVVDVGNSRVKWGRVADHRVTDFAALPHDEPVQWKRQAEAWGLNAGTTWVVAGVHPPQVMRFVDWATAREDWVEAVDTARVRGLTFPRNFHLDSSLPDPDSIGVDRVLTALAARSRTLDGIACVVVTVGTAMTVDLVRPDGAFAGGAILPGPTLMARSLSTNTAKLPWVDATADRADFHPGRNTKEAIEVGIAAAVIGAGKYLVREWSRTMTVAPWVFITGGATPYLAGVTFSVEPAQVVHDRTLTLDGLRLAAEALP